MLTSFLGATILLGVGNANAISSMISDIVTHEKLTNILAQNNNLANLQGSQLEIVKNMLNNMNANFTHGADFNNQLLSLQDDLLQESMILEKAKDRVSPGYHLEIKDIKSYIDGVFVPAHNKAFLDTKSEREDYHLRHLRSSLITSEVLIRDAAARKQRIIDLAARIDRAGDKEIKDIQARFLAEVSLSLLNIQHLLSEVIAARSATEYVGVEPANMNKKSSSAQNTRNASSNSGKKHYGGASKLNELWNLY